METITAIADQAIASLGSKIQTTGEVSGVARALSFLDACVRAGELHPEGAENPCDVWHALSTDSRAALQQEG